MDVLNIAKPLLLDGGLATELERSHNKDLSGHLWSAQFLKDDPNAIKEVHLAYYIAGADIATTCSYQASFEGFDKAKISREQAEILMKRSVQIANEARDAFLSEQSTVRGRSGRPLVALSLGCYGAMLATEYTGDYFGATTDQLVEFHRQRLRVFLTEPGIDLIAFETIPSLQEAEAIRQLLCAEPTTIPCWVSFSCRDAHHVSHGESLVECISRFHDVASVSAVGVNCTKPKYVNSLLTDVKTELDRVGSDKWIIVYPDGGDTWDAGAREFVPETAILPHNFGVCAREWVQKFGPKIIIGGCCRTTPSHISNLQFATI